MKPGTPNPPASTVSPSVGRERSVSPGKSTNSQSSGWTDGTSIFSWLCSPAEALAIPGGTQGEERFACLGWLSKGFLLKNRRKRAESTGELCFLAHYGRRGCEPSLTDGKGNLAMGLVGNSALEAVARWACPALGLTRFSTVLGVFGRCCVCGEGVHPASNPIPTSWGAAGCPGPSWMRSCWRGWSSPHLRGAFLTFQGGVGKHSLLVGSG